MLLHRHYECCLQEEAGEEECSGCQERGQRAAALQHQLATSAASQPLTGAHQGASNSRDAPRAYSADLEQHYQRANRAIRPVGKLGQAMPAAEAAALLAAVHTFSRHYLPPSYAPALVSLNLMGGCGSVLLQGLPVMLLPFLKVCCHCSEGNFMKRPT